MTIKANVTLNISANHGTQVVPIAYGKDLAIVDAMQAVVTAISDANRSKPMFDLESLPVSVVVTFTNYL